MEGFEHANGELLGLTVGDVHHIPVPPTLGLLTLLKGIDVEVVDEVGRGILTTGLQRADRGLDCCILAKNASTIQTESPHDAGKSLD